MVRLIDRDAVVGRVGWCVPGEVGVNRGRMLVVVGVLVDVRMHEGRTHGADLNGHGHAEGESPTNHVTIVYQNHPERV